MCSNCDCDQAPIKAESSTEVKSCRRCGANPFIVLDKVHIECRKCFLESCNKKLRSTIGKSKLIKNNDPILVAHSGGASSTALLDLIKNSMEYDARREQKFRPSILHIDTQSAMVDYSDSGTDAQAERAVKLKSLLDYTNRLCPDWPLYWTTLEMSMQSQSNCDNQPLYLRYDPERALTDPMTIALLNNAHSQRQLSLATRKLDLTDRQEYIRSCTVELINRVANGVNVASTDSDLCFKYVFTASSATQLANNLLVDVILGRGATMRSTVSICDTRPPVPTLRPMRDFSKKEIAFYLKARDISSHVQTNMATFSDRKASIQKVTEAFLSKLYVDYPSTYSTLLRTGNKMQD